MRGVIIGCGLIARSHALAIQRNSKAQLVGVCDVNITKAESLASEYDVKGFTDAEVMIRTVKPDFAVICVPTYLHKEYTGLCADARVHVLCEKPLERTYDRSKFLVDSVKKTNIIFMTAQVVRFWPGYDRIKQLYEHGHLGNILMIHLRRVSSRDDSYSRWLFDPDLGGGAMYDMLVHDVDYLRYLCGGFDYCYANAVKDDTGCYNNVFANIIHKNGVHSIAECSFNMQKGYPFSFSVKIVGTEATVEFNYSAGATIADRSSSLSEMKIWRNSKPVDSFIFDLNIDPYQIQMDYFLDCVESNRYPEIITPEESMEVIQMIEAIYESAENNKVIKIN